MLLDSILYLYYSCICLGETLLHATYMSNIKRFNIFHNIRNMLAQMMTYQRFIFARCTYPQMTYTKIDANANLESPVAKLINTQ